MLNAGSILWPSMVNDFKLLLASYSFGVTLAGSTTLIVVEALFKAYSDSLLNSLMETFDVVQVIVPVVVGFILNENVFDLALVFKSSKCKSVPPDAPAPLQEALPPIV